MSLSGIIVLGSIVRDSIQLQPQTFKVFGVTSMIQLLLFFLSCKFRFRLTHKLIVIIVWPSVCGLFMIIAVLECTTTLMAI